MDSIQTLRLLLRLSERGTFSAAARDLKIKQSTASKWVAALEEQLGVTLVERTTRKLRFSAAGRRLLERAADVITTFDEVTGELRDGNRDLRGHVRISVPVVFGNRFIVDPVIAFLQQHPQVEIELVLDDRYVNLVEDGFDVAIRVGATVDTTAIGRKLADGRRRLVAAPAYLKARGTPRRPRDLTRHECLMHGEGAAPAIWRFAKHGTAAPLAVRGRASANHSEAVLQMARSGLGIALLADWLVADDIEHGRLVTLLPDFTTPPAPVYALFPNRRYTRTVIAALVEHLAAALATRLPSR